MTGNKTAYPGNQLSFTSEVVVDGWTATEHASVSPPHPPINPRLQYSVERLDDA